MTRMSTRIGTNMAEYAENATELPEFATESLDFVCIWTRIKAELKKKKKIFQEVYMGMQELYSDLFCIRLIRLYFFFFFSFKHILLPYVQIIYNSKTASDKGGKWVEPQVQ